MENYLQKFKTLAYILQKSNAVLLFAHSSPDGDTAGSVLALAEHISSQNKNVEIACLDPLPEFLSSITQHAFKHPDSIDFSAYDSVIACDSVERGFQRYQEKIPAHLATVIIDHHPDISISADLVIIDSSKSSTCEIIYDYLAFSKTKITKHIATFLMLGILSDTGNFIHANTSTDVLKISSDLMKKGASFSKIIKSTFSNKSIPTLKLWGIAFEKAKINPANGMIATVLTKKDMDECQATSEDIGQVASILNTVPGTKFALVLIEREDNTIKGSLRSEDYKGVDVSAIAHQFGGGGHKLASGFEVKGRIVETEDGWEIV